MTSQSSRAPTNSRTSGRKGKGLRRMATYIVVAGFVLTQLIISSFLVHHGTLLGSTGVFPSFDYSSKGALMADEDSRLLINDVHEENADGYFNTIPITKRVHNGKNHRQQYSSMHCIGETHDTANSWMYRSCSFRNLCFDTSKSDFVLLHNPSEIKLMKNRFPQTFISTSMYEYNATGGVAIGGINPRWFGNDFNQGIEKVRWFPRIVHPNDDVYDIYEFPSSVVMVPFHSLAAHNVGHLLWDDFLPVFNLLQIFGLANDQPQRTQRQIQSSNQNVQFKYQHLLLRYVLPQNQFLYGTCEMRRKKVNQCLKNLLKFLPLMGVNPQTFSTTRSFQLKWKNDQNAVNNKNGDNNKIPLICSKHAVAGLGMLTDHGFKDHGWDTQQQGGQVDRTHMNQQSMERKYNNPHHFGHPVVHNVGRGPLLYNFRNYLVSNLLGTSNNPTELSAVSSPTYKIVFSIHSSSDYDRDLDFVSQINVVRQAFPNTPVEVVQFSNLTLTEQVTLVSQETNLLVTACGGGAVTSTFLRRGSSIIMYYKETGGFNFHNFNLTGSPARLDWDLLNNAGYLRVHWLPIGPMNTERGLELLVNLVRHEIDMSGISLDP